MEQKQILVVCSSPNGFNFKEPMNIRLRSLLFGQNPNYMFCDGYNGSQSFPTCPPDDGNKYDFIWFAGCNFIQSIFKSNAIEKIKDILKPNGHILFTESEYIKKGRRMDYEPTPDEYDEEPKSALIRYIKQHGTGELDSGNWKKVAEEMFVTLSEDNPDHAFDKSEKKEITEMIERNMHNWYEQFKFEQVHPPNSTVTLETLISHSEHVLPHSYNAEMAARVKDSFQRVDLHNDFVTYKIKPTSEGGNKKSKKYKRKNKHHSARRSRKTKSRS